MANFNPFDPESVPRRFISETLDLPWAFMAERDARRKARARRKRLAASAADLPSRGSLFIIQ
jgi:hypothetical protein